MCGSHFLPMLGGKSEYQENSHTDQEYARLGGLETLNLPLGVSREMVWTSLS